MTSNSNFPLIKKLGRPLGSKNKRYTRPAKKSVSADKAFKQDDERKVLLTTLIQELTARINSLEHQAVGYRAVISYLEHQIGKTK